VPSRVLIRRSPIVYLALFALVAVLLVATARFAFGGTFDGGSDQSRIVAAVKADKPSVVALQVTVNGTQYVPVDPFGDTQAQNVQGRASGSGFVYSKSGLIVTNAHVVSPPTGGRSRTCRCSSRTAIACRATSWASTPETTSRS